VILRERERERERASERASGPSRQSRRSLSYTLVLVDVGMMHCAVPSPMKTSARVSEIVLVSHNVGVVASQWEIESQRRPHTHITHTHTHITHTLDNRPHLKT
jgi:hypothetical protein